MTITNRFGSKSKGKYHNYINNCRYSQQAEMPKDYKTKDAEYRIQRLSISFTQMSDELTANI